MTKVENDTTRDPTPAIIVAGPRTGGTFLAHGLSNHPQVYCERQEVMHVDSSYRQVYPPPKFVTILEMVWGETGYLVAACKLQYSQAGYAGVWDYIKERQARVIHLRRRNKARQAISLIINEMARSGAIPFHPQHARATPARITVTIEPERLLKTVEKIKREEATWDAKLAESELPVLKLSYRRIIGAGITSAPQIAPPAVKAICEFLSIQNAPMAVGIRRINPWPLDKMLANWNEIEPLLGRPEFDGCEIGGIG